MRRLKFIILLFSLIIFIPIIAFLVMLAIAAYGPIEWKESIEDFIVKQEYILGYFFDEETIYGDKYTYKAWKSVKFGDTIDSVMLKLGEPLDKINEPNNNELCYHYSKQGPKDTNYRRRIICFDSTKRVKDIIQEFYLD